jgi:hypothetical protein
MNFSEQFYQALEDYMLLLNKSYPQKTILELVGTRYSLNHFERSMLYRGITEKEKAKQRNKKVTKHQKLKGQVLHIDLFNALFTIAAYLRGFPVYLANDGILRDASESHGCSDWIDHLEQGLSLTMEFTKNEQPEKMLFYIDNPLEYCRKVVEKIHDHCQEAGIDHEIILHDSPDHLLEKAKTGILASSDSTIIDRTQLPVLDLPRAVLEFHFVPTFISFL